MPIPASFVPWFTELCRLGGMSDPQAAIEASALMLDDVIVAIHPSLTAPQSDLLFQVPLGSLPAGDVEAAPILRRLLEVQMLLSGPAAPSFGLSVGSDVVFVSVALRPAELEVNAAVQVLGMLARLVRTLRESLHLQQSVQGAPAASEEVQA
ncbi:MAG TPA: hypothetical protein VFR90_09880 [Methylibium sp.]|uniref:hypothetical protein n=1 Tax=Methylibium sp. TaxID=2067992 RepID=UPI002DB7B4C9|nr:hypothetical protein [Methylibium sp.]HEU4459419.1 hypothetical protein [Methylibium sp.]